MLLLGWAIAAISGVFIFYFTEYEHLRGWLSQRKFAEFLCTFGRLISPLDRSSRAHPALRSDRGDRFKIVLALSAQTQE